MTRPPIITALTLAVALPCSSLAAQEERPPSRGGTIEWRVEDRYRLFANADETAKANLASLMAELGAKPTEKLSGFYEDFLNLLTDPVTSPSLRSSNYVAGKSGVSSGRYSDDYLYPESYSIAVHYPSGHGERCDYTLKVAIPVRASGPCNTPVRFTLPRTVAADIAPDAPPELSVAVGGTIVASAPFTFKDELVVALGDSFISGEGNPDEPVIFNQDGIASDLKRFKRYSWPGKLTRQHVAKDAQWWDETCHRSLLSWPVLATLAHSARNPHQAVTLLHTGCSGATLEEIIAHGVAEAPGGGSVQDSQLLQVRKLLANAPGGAPTRSVDKVLLSIGGNDIGFVGVLTTLILPPNGYTLGGIGARAVGSGAGAICPYRDTGKPLSRLCRKEVAAQERVTSLHTGYSKLGIAFRDFGIAPDQVFHAQYPNPLICKDGRPCDNSTANGNETDVEEGYYGFEAIMGLLPKIARGWRFKSWNFEMQYIPDKSFDPDRIAAPVLLYPSLPGVQCDAFPEPTDSEICQAMLVHYWLNQEVERSGFRQISAHLKRIEGHGVTRIGEGYRFEFPRVKGGRWIGTKPGDFRPYARPEAARWFRLPNDSALTQVHLTPAPGCENVAQPEWDAKCVNSQFYQGTAHPTYRAHLEYAQATLEEAF